MQNHSILSLNYLLMWYAKVLKMCRALKQLCLVLVELQMDVFIAKTGCEIVELGPKFETIHKIDEKIEKV